MAKHTPKTRLNVTGMMTKQGADRVGLILALTAAIGVSFSGLALVLFVVL